MKGFIAAFLGGLVISYLIVLGTSGGNAWLLIVIMAIIFAAGCCIFGSLFNKMEQLEADVKKLLEKEPADVSRETSLKKTRETGLEE